MPFTTTGGKCARCFDQHKCPYCPEQTFYNSLTLIEHLKNTSDHCDAEEAIFSCSICNNKSFSSKTAYIHHLQQKQIHKYDLHQAACCGKYEDVDRLTRLENMNITGTSHKVNPNSQISSHVGSTPMHCAAYNGYSRCLKVMLSWPECNPNVPDEIDGRTPVHVAAERGKETCLKLLLKKGGKLDLKDKNGDTPIKLVSSFRCVVVIVHYLRHCIKQDDFGDVMLDELVNLVEGFFDQHENRNAVECAQSTTDIQISKESSAVSADLLPYEVLARGEKCIEAFKKAMLDGKAPASRMKLIVLGEVGAGKTSLTRSLSGQAFEEAREETRGIETSSVSEMMQNTELDGSWKLADPADSHVDQVIANLLSQYLDLNDLPDIYKFLRLGNCMMAPLASLPQSSGEHLSDEIVQSPAKEFDQYPGLSTPSGTQSRFLVTEEMVDVEGSPRKLPASLIARTLLQKDNTGVSVKVNIWDFAGHQLYETMHHVFLNSRSLYLVVFSLLKFTESEEKSLATIHYWLNSIAVHTSDSTPIFLVGTHKAKVDEKQVKYADRLLVKHFEDAFGSRLVRKSEDKCIFAVENSHCQDDEGVSCLITAIKKEASNLSFVSEELPVKWLHCEEEIFTRQQDPNCEKCLSIEEVRKLFEEKCHVQFTDEEFRLMLNFFHDSGLIILPDNMCSEGMKSCIKNLVVLSPQYLVDVMTDIHDAPKRLAMKRQFSRELKKMQKEGVVGSRLLEHVRGEAEKPTEVLIELLGHFNLLYPLYAANENEDKQGNPQLSISSPSHSPSSFPSHNLEYIIPCLLKGKHGESLEKNWDKISEGWKEKSDEDHVFVLDFGRFLPSALFDYLLVHIYRQSQNTKGMKPVLRRSEGIFSFSNKFLFRIKLVLKDSQIWIYATCKHGCNFLDLVAVLVEEVTDICQQYFKYLKFIHGPPCPRKDCPGACVDVEAVQRPCDSSSSESQESSDEETEKDGASKAFLHTANQTGRRVHVISMSYFEPPYWCQQVEIDEEELKNWKPNSTFEMNESFDDVDTTDCRQFELVRRCCLSLVADSIGGDEWKHMGRELCLDESKMENIGSEQRKQEERAHQVLLLWRRSVGKDATVKKLETILVKIKRKDVAEKLVKHQSEH